jgi:hypothetical protein
VATQERIRAGVRDDAFPYPEEIRFARRFATMRPPPPALPRTLPESKL